MALTLVPGQSVQFVGASMSAPAGVYWTVAISATGASTPTNPLTGEGNQDNLSFTVGPFNTPGAAVSVTAVVTLYSDFARTQTIGASQTFSSGVVASVQTAAPTPTSAPNLSVTTGNGALVVSWGAVANAVAYEIVDSLGLSWSVTGGGLTHIGADSTGGSGTFVAATSVTALTAPGPGMTDAIQVRAVTAEGPSGAAGPWAYISATMPSGAPNVQMVGVSLALTSSGQAPKGFLVPQAVVTATFTNTGTADGVSPTWSAVVSSSGFIWTSGADVDGVTVPAGQTATATFTLLFPTNYNFSQWPAGGEYTVWAARGMEWTNQSEGAQLPFSPGSGTFQATTTMPGGLLMRLLPSRVRMRGRVAAVGGRS